MDIQYPDYPCVAFLAKTKQLTYNPDGSKKPVVIGDEILYYPISGVDDLSHVDQMRKFKGFAVVGFANIEKILERAPYKRNEVTKLTQELRGLCNPPELRRAMERQAAEASRSEPVPTPAGTTSEEPKSEAPKRARASKSEAVQ